MLTDHLSVCSASQSLSVLPNLGSKAVTDHGKTDRRLLLSAARCPLSGCASGLRTVEKLWLCSRPSSYNLHHGIVWKMTALLLLQTRNPEIQK